MLPSYICLPLTFCLVYESLIFQNFHTVHYQNFIYLAFELKNAHQINQNGPPLFSAPYYCQLSVVVLLENKYDLIRVEIIFIYS